MALHCLQLLIDGRVRDTTETTDEIVIEIGTVAEMATETERDVEADHRLIDNEGTTRTRTHRAETTVRVREKTVTIAGETTTESGTETEVHGGETTDVTTEEIAIETCLMIEEALVGSAKTTVAQKKIGMSLLRRLEVQRPTALLPRRENLHPT